MSYRTYINDHQIFGNNEGFEEWFDFLTSHGIEVKEGGSYDGYIDDLQGMFEVIDKITSKLIEDRHKKVVSGELDWQGKPLREMTDLSDSMWLADQTPLLMFNMQVIQNYYCFLPYQVFKAVEDIIEESKRPYVGDKEWYLCTYHLKEGEKIHVYAR